MRRIILSIAIFFIFNICNSQLCVDNGKIVVSIEELRNNKGRIKVGLFNNKEGFPDKPEKAFKILFGTIENFKSEVIFDNIPCGEYAIGIFHDENGNAKMDCNLFGIPKEGYGASNNAKGLMGPPKFKDAKFELKNSSLKIIITACY